MSNDTIFTSPINRFDFPYIIDIEKQSGCDASEQHQLEHALRTTQYPGFRAILRGETVGYLLLAPQEDAPPLLKVGSKGYKAAQVKTVLVEEFLKSTPKNTGSDILFEARDAETRRILQTRNKPIYNLKDEPYLYKVSYGPVIAEAPDPVDDNEWFGNTQKKSSTGESKDTPPKLEDLLHGDNAWESKDGDKGDRKKKKKKKDGNDAWRESLYDKKRFADEANGPISPDTRLNEAQQKLQELTFMEWDIIKIKPKYYPPETPLELMNMELGEYVEDASEVYLRTAYKVENPHTANQAIRKFLDKKMEPYNETDPAQVIVPYKWIENKHFDKGEPGELKDFFKPYDIDVNSGPPPEMDQYLLKRLLNRNNSPKPPRR